MARSFKDDPRWAVIARALVFVLSLPVLLGPSMPYFARLAAGARAHVCHCDARHTDCACPVCFPDREDLKKNDLAITAPCGDTDPIFSTPSLPAVLAAPSALVFAPSVGIVHVAALAPLESRGPSPPEPPPPEA